jgi:hypothetical protein
VSFSWRGPSSKLSSSSSSSSSAEVCGRVVLPAGCCCEGAAANERLLAQGNWTVVLDGSPTGSPPCPSYASIHVVVVNPLVSCMLSSFCLAANSAALEFHNK